MRLVNVPSSGHDFQSNIEVFTEHILIKRPNIIYLPHSRSQSYSLKDFSDTHPELAKNLSDAILVEKAIFIVEHFLENVEELSL